MQQAVPSVWMITDRTTGEPSYIHMDDEAGTQRLIGPFAYTSENDAREAARTRSFLPQSIGPVELDATEIEGMGFVTGILTRFDPSNTDVVVLDDGLLPLTENGAVWVDDTTGKGVWQELFDGDPTKWIDVVLEQVSERLGVEVIRVDHSAPASTSKAAAAHAKIDKKVTLHCDPESAAFYGEVDPKVNYRISTIGMGHFGRPDIEMGGVPPLFAGMAMTVLKGWAAYSLDHPLQAGMSLVGTTSPLHVILSVKAVDDRLRLEVEQVIHIGPADSQMVH
jgi:hypothetical protein